MPALAPVSCVAQEDLESATPLLQSARAQHESSKKRIISEYTTFLDRPYEEDLTPCIVDPMTYKLPWLKAWGVFSVVKDTVWDNPCLWLVMKRLCFLGSFFLLLAYAFLPDPTLLDVSKFSDMNNILSTFVTLMLSFFLASAVQRWIGCVNAITILFASIKNYTVQLHALGVSHDKIELAQRYCVLSVFFLVHSLRVQNFDEEKTKMATKLMWDHLDSGRDKYASVEPAEKEMLLMVDNKSSQMWIWIASHLGRMAEDGDVPPMASPTYGRLMNLLQGAQDGAREMKLAVSVQMPIVYIHTLAFLVHVNCILFAVITGTSLGSTLHAIHDHIYDVQHVKGHGLAQAIQKQPMGSEIQALFVEAIKGFLAPLLLQAFLHIGLSILSPLEDDDAAIPTSKLVHDLERDLQDGILFASRPPHWKPPSFKRPADSLPSAGPLSKDAPQVLAEPTPQSQPSSSSAQVPADPSRPQELAEPTIQKGLLEAASPQSQPSSSSSMRRPSASAAGPLPAAHATRP